MVVTRKKYTIRQEKKQFLEAQETNWHRTLKVNVVNIRVPQTLWGFFLLFLPQPTLPAPPTTWKDLSTRL